MDERTPRFRPVIPTLLVLSIASLVGASFGTLAAATTAVLGTVGILLGLRHPRTRSTLVRLSDPASLPPPPVGSLGHSKSAAAMTRSRVRSGIG